MFKVPIFQVNFFSVESGSFGFSPSTWIGMKITKFPR